MTSRVTLILVLLLPGVVFACLWDKDTLEMERQKVPSALEVITGKFLRHSEEYYQWRINDREQRLENLPIDAFLKTDLAVAYYKSGDIERAIELQTEVEEKNPGQYETYANLGTFYIDSGQYEKGIAYVEKAMEINAEAHFGRALYQKLLAMYLKLRTNEDGGELRLPLKRGDSKINIVEFRDYIGVTEPVDEELRDRDVYLTSFHSFVSFYFNHHGEGYDSTDAIMGMVGIMRFADHTSPILLEALGDLLSKDGYEGEQRLAARAYLKAADSVSDKEIKLAYRKLAKEILHSQVFGENRDNNASKLAEIERAFVKELKESEDYFSEVIKNEKDWIAGGLDVDAEFKKTYFDEPEVKHSSVPLSRGSAGPQKQRLLVITVITLFSFAVVIVGRRLIFRRKSGRESS